MQSLSLTTAFTFGSNPLWMCLSVGCKSLHFPLLLQPDDGRLDLDLPEDLSPFKLILMALYNRAKPNGHLIAKGKLFAEIWKQLPLVVTPYMYLILISSVNSIVSVIYYSCTLTHIGLRREVCPVLPMFTPTAGSHSCDLSLVLFSSICCCCCFCCMPWENCFGCRMAFGGPRSINLISVTKEKCVWTTASNFPKAPSTSVWNIKKTNY